MEYIIVHRINTVLKVREINLLDFLHKQMTKTEKGTFRMLMFTILK